MRIISGKYKGKTIYAPKNLPVRPTTDFAKEGLFNVLNNEFNLKEIEVLELFSGTGNMAYEFVSRGAKKLLCIDQNYHCVSFIKKTSRELGIKQLSVFKNDVFKYLKHYKQSFDIIFADPPYDLEEIPLLPELVFNNKLLNQNGWLIIEHDKHTDLSESPHFLALRKYGNVNFSIFEN
jgi:16S rRNA (guanine(966)-N(2))-methyltransferase RsmD